MKKLLAVLLTVALLVLMCVPALAATGDITCRSHRWSEETVRKATCTHKGTIQRVCQVCGATETTRTRALGHKWGSWTVTKEATCTEQGSRYHICSRCGEKETEKIRTADHSWGEWTVVREATEHSTGLRSRTCSVCGTADEEEFYPEGTLKRGDSGDAVKDLQQDLNNNGYTAGKPDGVFGKKTEDAVKAAEEENGMEPDGIAWPDVIELMSFIPEEPAGADTYTYGISLEIVSGPEGYMEEGETAPATLRVTNTGNTYITVNRQGMYYTVGEQAGMFCEDYMKFSAGSDIWSKLGPGESYEIDLKLTAAEYDVLEGVVGRECRVVGNAWFNATGTPATPEDYQLPLTSGDIDIESNSVFFEIPIAAGEDEQDDPVVPTVTVEKTVTSEPGDGRMYYVPGETVTYSITVTNNSDVDIQYISLYDPLKGSNEDAVIVTADTLAGGASIVGTFDYVVTKQDAVEKSITNIAYAGWYDTASDKLVDVPSNLVRVRVLDEREEEEEDDDDFTFTVTKRVAEGEAPENGMYYQEGETVTFEIAIDYDGPKDVENVKLYEMLPENTLVADYGTVTEGFTATETYDYVITKEDAEGFAIENTAELSYTENGIEFRVPSNPVIVPTGPATPDDPETPDEPFGVITDLTVTKTETSMPVSNPAYYVEGETITYAITYTNTGETDFGEVIIYDSLKGGSHEIASAEHLYSSQSLTCYFSHVVTKADCAKGYVKNVAYAVADSSGYPFKAASNAVISPCGGGEPDPTPTITLDPIDDCCTRTQLTRSDNSQEFKIDYCAIHGAIEDVIVTALNTAEDELTTRKVLENASAMWQSEIDAMYDILWEAADCDAKVIVLADRLSFAAEAATLRARLTAVDTEDPFMVEYRVAELLMNRCVDMCYALGNASAGRLDSLKDAEVVENKEAADICMTEVTDQSEGTATYENILCAEHAVSMKLANALLAKGENERSRTAVATLWQAEEEKTYNAAAALQDKQLQPLYKTERAAFDQWLDAREALLKVLYPDIPEIAIEITTQARIDRICRLCLH